MHRNGYFTAMCKLLVKILTSSFDFMSPIFGSFVLILALDYLNVLCIFTVWPTDLESGLFALPHYDNNFRRAWSLSDDLTVC